MKLDSANNIEGFHFICYLKRDQRRSYLRDLHDIIEWRPIGNLKQAFKFVHRDTGRISTLDDFGIRPKSLKNGNGELRRSKTPPVSEIAKMTVDEMGKIFTPAVYLSAVRAKAHYELHTTPDQELYKDMSTIGIYYFGDSGVGKSLGVRNKYKGNLYIKDTLSKWWDGYKGQENVLIDDFGLEARKMPESAHNLKIWSQGYYFCGETKGSTLSMNNVKRLIITSQYTFEQIYGKTDLALLIALNRRFEFITVTLQNREELFWEQEIV